MKNILTILVLCFLFNACSPQRRLQRLILKHPELAFVDTIKTIDTAITQRHEFNFTTQIPIHDSSKLKPFSFARAYIDSNNNLLSQPQTIYEDRHVKIRGIFVNTILGRSLKIEGSVKPDTVIIENKTPVQKIIIPKLNSWERLSFFHKCVIFLIVMVVCYLLVRVITK